jgi:hypothetical protein
MQSDHARFMAIAIEEAKLGAVAGEQPLSATARSSAGRAA